MVSLAFRAFGVFSNAAGFAMLVFNSVFSALTSWTIYRIARRVFNETVAVWSGWVWALLPYAIYYSVAWIWETSLSAFLLSLLFMLTLEMEGDDRLSSWFGYGLLWGIAALTNTSVACVACPSPDAGSPTNCIAAANASVVPVVLSAVVFWMVLMPWLVRNYSVFGEPVFVRDNFGNEFRAGNNPQAEGWMVSNYHAASNLPLFKQMGEAAINTEQADEAKAWIAQHPKRFLVLCSRRFIFFWAGLPRTWAGLPRTGLGRVRNLFFLASSLLAIGGLLLAFKRRVHGGVAVRHAIVVLSVDLLHYFHGASVPPSHRAGTGNTCGILDLVSPISLAAGGHPGALRGMIPASGNSPRADGGLCPNPCPQLKKEWCDDSALMAELWVCGSALCRPRPCPPSGRTPEFHRHTIDEHHSDQD